MARTRSSLGAPMPEPPIASSTQSASSTTPRKRVAPHKKAVRMSVTKDAPSPPEDSPRSKRVQETEAQEEVQQEVTKEAGDTMKPPAKRRKATAAVASPARAAALPSDAARRAHIGSKLSPGNGQLDYTLCELLRARACSAKLSIALNSRARTDSRQESYFPLRGTPYLPPQPFSRMRLDL